MLPPTPLLMRPKRREWLIAACATSLVTLLLWTGLAYLRDPHYSPEFVAGLRDLEAKRGPEAQNMFDHALRSRPADTDLYLTICEQAQQTRQYPVLTEYARRGLQNCPNAPLGIRLTFMASLVTGLTESRPAEWRDEALKVSKQAYDLAPDEPQIQNLYAYNLADLRDDPASLKEAETILAKALQILSKQSDSDTVRDLRALTQDSYGWARCRQGDYPGAIDAINQALSGLTQLEFRDKAAQDDALKTVYYHLGVAQRGAGDLDAARAALQRALSYDANYADAKAELAAIKA